MKALILCGALTALAAPAFAIAGPATTDDTWPVAGLYQTYQTTVSFADLDLNRTSGADTALARIKLAARKVCGARPSPRELVPMIQHRSCVVLAVDNGVADLGAPLVTARYVRGDVARLASR